MHMQLLRGNRIIFFSQYYTIVYFRNDRSGINKVIDVKSKSV